MGPPAARAGRRHGTAGLTGLRRFHDRGGLASARVRDAETTAIMNVSAATGAARGAAAAIMSHDQAGS